MLPRGVGAQQGLRWGLFSLVTGISLLTVTSDPSDARAHRRSIQANPNEVAADEPRYSDIVVDGNSGTVLHAANPDATRHPASLTKIMTLYLLFEQLEAGRFKLDTPLQVSEHAAGQSPTKLGLRSGQTIKVEDAIKGIVTRSANDAAVVVAEAVGGDEESFARLMTRKAQAIGMAHTVYRNASGLPNDEQITTARDQSILGRTVQERFPRYYKYFATRTFEWHGESIGNHNHLLGSVEGVDGIKTGYIGASGFNLVTSVHRNNRYLVAVVFGGSSAGARDARMRELIQDHIAEASTQRTASMLAAAEPEIEAKSESRPEAKPEAKPELKPEPKPEAKPKPEGTKPTRAAYAIASATSVPVTLTSKSDPGVTRTIQVPRWTPTSPIPASAAAPMIGSAEPIRPVMVHTISLRPGSAVQTASLAPPGQAGDAKGTGSTPAVASPVEPPPPTAASRPAAAPTAAAPTPSSASGSSDVLPPPTMTASLPAAAAVPAAAPPAPARASAQSTSAPGQTHTGWMIQVGAFPAADEAKQRLSLVQSRAARFLASADPFTETVTRGDTTMYRARFAGLAKEQAEAACNYLKHNDVECMTIKN
jgi:D-alanyl-D-alanine carboxypeptidase